MSLFSNEREKVMGLVFFVWECWLMFQFGHPDLFDRTDWCYDMVGSYGFTINQDEPPCP